MEATASFLERPPKCKRESPCSRSGPGDESRSAKPMEPRNQVSTQACESKLCTDPRTPYSPCFYNWNLPPTMTKRHQPRSPSEPWPVSWSAWTRRTLAARLVTLHRRLWESYVAKNAESQGLDKENQQLKNASRKRNDTQSATPWDMTSSCPTTRKHTRRSKKVSSGPWRIGRNPWSTPQMLASKMNTSRTAHTSKRGAFSFLLSCQEEQRITAEPPGQ